MAQLARVLGRLPASLAAAEELLQLLERVQPLAAQTLLQHAAAAADAAGGVGIQSSRQRWLARVGPPHHGPSSSSSGSCGTTNFQRSFAAANAVVDTPPAQEATSISSNNTSSNTTSSSSSSRWDDAAVAEWRKRQQQQQQKAADALSPLELSIKMSPTLQALAGVVGQNQATLPPAALLRALNRLTWFCKQQQQQQQQQQQWLMQPEAAAPGERQKQQQLVQQVAAQLLQRLPQVQAALPAAKLLQVLHCLAQLGPDTITASLGGIASSAGSSSNSNGSSEAFCRLLAPVLQQLGRNMASLQAKHLPLLAHSLALLNVTGLIGDPSTETDAAADAAAADGRGTDSTAAASASATATATEQAGRQLLAELCDAVRKVPVASTGAAAGTAARSFDMPGLAKLFSAMARLGHYDWQMMQHLSQMAINQEQEPISPSNLVSLLVGSAKLHHYDPGLCNMLAAAAADALPAATGTQLAQIAWALATLKIDHPGAFAAVARQGILRSSELEPRHISNLAWAFTVRKASHPGLFDALAARVLQLGPAALEPHHLSLVAWSFAKQGHRREGLMSSIGDQAAAVADLMRPQNVSNLAWAFGALARPHEALFAALAAAAKAAHLEGYANQNISDLAWGCAATGYQDPELFDLLARATLNDMGALSPHSLSDLTYAFAALKHPAAPSVLASAAPAAAACLDRFSLGMLADLLWSFAFVGVRDGDLLAAAAAVLPQRSLSMAADMRSAAKVLWALRTLQFRDEAMEQQLAEAVPGIKALLDS